MKKNCPHKQSGNDGVEYDIGKEKRKSQISNFFTQISKMCVLNEKIRVKSIFSKVVTQPVIVKNSRKICEIVKNLPKIKKSSEIV